MAFVGVVLIILILVGIVGATRPRTSNVQYVTTTSYVTSLQSQFVTTTQLEQVAVTQVVGTASQLVEYCFSPGGDCASVLIRWTASARTSIHVLIRNRLRSNISDQLMCLGVFVEN
jgi:hypothetical protein